MKREKINTLSFIVSVFLAVAFCLVPLSASAEQPAKIATVSQFEGEVFVKSKTMKPVGEWVKLKKDVQVAYTLYSGDELKTGKGTAEIKFEDESIVQLTEKTSITIDEGMKRRKIFGILSEAYLSRTIKLAFGSIWADIKPNKEKKTDFESPTIVAGVKGTTLSFRFDPATGQVTIRSGKGDILDVTDINGTTRMTFQDGQVDVKVDPSTGQVSFKSVSGNHTVVTQDGSQANIVAGAEVGIKHDEATGSSNYEAKAGDVNVQSPDGTKAELKAGNSVEVKVDPATGSTNYTSVTGDITVTDNTGQSVVVGSGQSANAQGTAPGAAPPTKEAPTKDEAVITITPTDEGGQDVRLDTSDEGTASPAQ